MKESINDPPSSRKVEQQQHITAHYEIEQFTFYTTRTTVSEIAAAVTTRNTISDESTDSANNESTCHIDINDNTIDVKQFIPAVTVNIKYATTTYGGNIVVPSKASVSSSSSYSVTDPTKHSSNGISYNKNETENTITSSIITPSVERPHCSSNSVTSTRNGDDKQEEHISVKVQEQQEDDSYYDITGILIWPATHLLCQYLLLEYDNIVNMDNALLRHQQLPVIQQQQQLLQRHSTNNIVQHQQQKVVSILELGCGCGTVGSVFMKYHSMKQQQDSMHVSHTSTQETASNTSIHWYATDMDRTVLELCYDNLQRNTTKISYSNDVDVGMVHVKNNLNDTGANPATTNYKPINCCIVQKLCWGNTYDINQIMMELQKNTPITAGIESDNIKTQQGQQQQHKFHVIVAADIIYPSQSEYIIQQLFATIISVLYIHDIYDVDDDNNNDGSSSGGDGYVILSYCNRDYTFTTIQTLIRVATQYNFIITAPNCNNNNNNIEDHNNHHMIYNATLRKHYLPPLLDGQILILQYNNDHEYVTIRNSKQYLGHDTCTIFPKLYSTIQNNENRNKTKQEEDEWDEPPIFDE